MTPARTTLRVKFDEDVDVLLAPLLTAHGFDCLTTVAAGNLGRSNEEQLTFAFGESRILITHNRTDYETLTVSWWGQQREHAGVVLAIRRADTYGLARTTPRFNHSPRSRWPQHDNGTSIGGVQ